MPVPKRRKGESVQEYRRRLVQFFVNEGRPQKQSVAIAYSIANNRKFKKNNKGNRKGII